MDLVISSWRPSAYESGRTVEVPANYGMYGGSIDFEWTPTLVPPPDYDPHNPQWNRLDPVVWNQVVYTEADVEALMQAGLVQVSSGQPVRFTPPGVASLVIN